MTNQPALDQDEAEARLGVLDVKWGLIGGSELERVFEFSDFVSALAFVNQIGEIAEKQQHHPDIELSWGKVVVRLSTHDANGLTQADFDLAAEIDKIELPNPKENDQEDN